MKVARIMSPEPVVVRREASLETALALMDEHDVRHLPVLEGSRVVGVVSDRDLLDATGGLAPRQLEVLEGPRGCVGDLVHGPAVVVEPELELQHAVRLLVTGRIGSLPVVDGGRLVGIVTEMDVLRAYADACRHGLLTAREDTALRRHMTPSPATIEADASGDEARARMAEAGVRHLPVQDGERLVGILSDRDVRRFHGRGRLELALVREMMTPEPRTASPDKGLSHAAHILSTHRISALLMVEHGRLVGMLTLVDVLGPCATRLAACAS